MNPIVQQLAEAKDSPYALTSWGAFGPGWFWVVPVEGFDPANLQASVLGDDVTLTWDA